jgi:hypothetical protein
MWIAAFIMVGYLSTIVKDNIISRIAMETVVGAGIGHWLLNSSIPIIENVLKPLSQGSIYALLVLLLGMMILLRVVPRYGWLSRYPTAVLFGVGAGVSAAGAVFAQIVGQISATAVDLPSLVNQPFELFGAIFMIVGVITVLSYFIFTVPRRGALGYVQRYGRYLLMFAFGMGYTNSWAISAFQSAAADILFKTFGIPPPV